MVRIATHAKTYQFRIYLGPAGTCVLQRLKNKNSRAFTHYKPVPSAVPWATRLVRFLITAAEGFCGGKSGQRSWCNCSFRAARYHQIGVAECHHPTGLSNRMRAGGASRDNGKVWAPQAEHYRKIAGDHVDYAAGNIKRRNSSCALRQERLSGILNRLKPSNPRTNQNPDPI